MRLALFFRPTWRIGIVTLVLAVLHLVLILQLIPVFENDSINAEVVNAVVFPGNFFFEDLLGITSVRWIDVVTWLFHVGYDYVIVCTVRWLARH